jgi:hypothetical protein
MRVLRIFFLLCGAALSFLPAIARAYSSAELEGLLAPVALYPDPVLQDVLAASTTPDQVKQAADWARANPGMSGQDAVRAVQGRGWQPAVADLVAYPELLERMAQSPQWTADLGSAWASQQPEVMAVVQTLRQRAYASGSLKSDPYQTVESNGPAIAVAPAMPYLYYVPYYDPWVAYGPAWYPAYTPVYWRPWIARPVFVTRVVVRSGPAFVHPHPIPGVHSPGFAHPAPFVRGPVAARTAPRPLGFQRVPESRRQPIVQSRVQPAFPHPAMHAPQHFQGAHFSHPGWGSGTASRGGGRRS